MKKWLGILLSVALLLSFCGCGKQEAVETTAAETTVAETTEAVRIPVGLCLPNQTEQRWIEEGAALKKALEDRGYQVLLQDAADSVQAQAEQIGKLTEENVQCLIVAAVDSAVLSQSLPAAEQAGIPVVAYDRLLVNTDGVTGYVSFDYRFVGQTVAQALVAAKSLETAQAENRSYRVEFLMDTYQNHGSFLFYQGLMDTLKSYLDAGVLICPSGRVSFEDACVKTLDAGAIQARCENLLTEYPEEIWPDVLVAGNDALAAAWAQALNARQCPRENWPMITGQSTLAENAPEQLLAVHYDTAALAQACADAVDAALSGVPVGTQEIGNGAMGVPVALIKPEIAIPEIKEPPQPETEPATGETVPEETATEETQPAETRIEETISEETRPEETKPTTEENERK